MECSLGSIREVAINEIMAMTSNVTNIEVRLTPNDGDVTCSWRVRNRPVGRTLVNAADLEDCSNRIRRSLSEISSYIRTNAEFSEELDQEFKGYNKLLNNLRGSGYDLYNLLLPSVDTESSEKPSIRQYIEAAPKGSSFDVFVEDENVTIPLGFAHENGTLISPTIPSIRNFDGFWLSKFSITTWLDGVDYSPETQTIKSSNFRALFAVDNKEWSDAIEGLSDSFPECCQVFDIECGVHNTWQTARDTWGKMLNFDSLVFFLGHSNGSTIRLSGEEKRVTI
jgi:hypothetical protein